MWRAWEDRTLICEGMLLRHLLCELCMTKKFKA